MKNVYRVISIKHGLNHQC